MEDPGIGDEDMGLAAGVVEVVYDVGLLGRSIVGVYREYFALGDLEGAGN